METDLSKEELLQVVKNSYYLNADVIKFLLAENLALKTLLYEKGLISVDEYKECRVRANEILETKSRAQMAEQLKSLMKSAV